MRLLTVNFMADLVLMPMMGMRMFAEEEKQETLEMMLTLPGSLWSFVIGKFIMGFLLSTGLVLFTPVYRCFSLVGQSRLGRLYLPLLHKVFVLPFPYQWQYSHLF